MKKIEELLARLSQKQLAGFITAFVILAGYGSYQFILSPQVEALNKVQSEVANLENQIGAERRIAANLERYREEVRAYTAVQELAARQLPQGRDIPNLLTAVQTLAKDIGLDVRRFAPEEDKLRDDFAEIPVKIEMRGSFHQVVSFFDEVSRLSRVASISDLKLTNPRGYAEHGSVGLDVSCSLTAYRQLEESERRKPEKDGDKKGKGKKSGDGASVVKKK